MLFHLSTPVQNCRGPGGGITTFNALCCHAQWFDAKTLPAPLPAHRWVHTPLITTVINTNHGIACINPCALHTACREVLYIQAGSAPACLCRSWTQSFQFNTDWSLWVVFFISFSNNKSCSASKTRQQWANSNIRIEYIHCLKCCKNKDSHLSLGPYHFLCST